MQKQRLSRAAGKWAALLAVATLSSWTVLRSAGGDKPIIIGDGASVFVTGDIRFIIPRKDNSILIAPLGRVVADDQGVLVRYKDDNGAQPLCGNQANCMVTVHYGSDHGGGETGEVYFFHASAHRNLVILLPSGQFQSDPKASVPKFIQHGIKITSVVEQGRPTITTKGTAEIRIRYIAARARE